MKKLIFACFFLLLTLRVEAQSLPQEAVYAHLSKDIAATGESIHFKVFIRANSQYSDSKIAYVELIDRNYQPVLQVIFPLEDGQSENYLDIPTNLQSDHYLFRVYTRISPYLGDLGVYNQFITIVNPEAPPSVESVSAKPFSFPSSSSKTPQFNLQPIGTNSSFEIQQNLLPQAPKTTLSISLKNPYLTETSRGYFHSEIYQNINATKRLIPEPFGHIVYARTMDTDIDTTETYFLSSHGKQSVLNSSKPSLGGDLFFELGALKEYDFLIAQSSNQDKQLDFSPQSPFANLSFKNEFNFPPLVLEEKDKAFLQQVILAGRTGGYFFEEEKNEFMPIATGFVADKIYKLDDYTRFENIEVTLKEYVPEVLVRRQQRKMILKVQDKPLAAVFEENPLVLIDAMPVFDVDRLGKFDPQKIEKLEVLSREFFLNKDRFAGVVSFISFENDFGGFDLPENSLYLNYWTIQAGKKYMSPHLVQQPVSPNIPDFRTTLYWNTDFHKAAESLFYTSQTSGKYEIKQSFINEKGDWQLQIGEFSVGD